MDIKIINGCLFLGIFIVHLFNINVVTCLTSILCVLLVVACLNITATIPFVIVCVLSIWQFVIWMLLHACISDGLARCFYFLHCRPISFFHNGSGSCFYLS